ncbi:hypothetical protein [Hydrogenimonas sp.]
MAKYRFRWFANEHRFKIYPRHHDTNVTPFFGLGNSLVQFNPDNPPKKTIVVGIGEETPANQIVPPEVFDIRKHRCGATEWVERQVVPVSSKPEEKIKYAAFGHFRGEQFKSDGVKSKLQNYLAVTNRSERIDW